jgi:hypothetical protein
MGINSLYNFFFLPEKVIPLILKTGETPVGKTQARCLCYYGETNSPQKRLRGYLKK